MHVASLAQQHSPSREQNEQPDASISLASQERQSGDGLPITGIRAGGQLPFLQMLSTAHCNALSQSCRTVSIGHQSKLQTRSRSTT